MSIYDYSTTPGSNSSIDGTNIAEGCAPAGINNALRSLMADVAQLADDIGGALDTTGSSNTYAVTTAQTITAYADGLFLRIRANHTSSGAATLNVDSLGAKDLKKFTVDGVADIGTGDIQSGGVYDVAYDSGNDRLVVLGLTGGHKVGTWTPSVSASSGLTGTFSSYTGTHTKVGNLVFLNLVVAGTSMSFTNSSSFLTLSGLPYAPVTYAAGAFGSTTANSVNGVAVINSGSNVLTLSNETVNGTTDLLIASVTYRAAT